MGHGVRLPPARQRSRGRRSPRATRSRSPPSSRPGGIRGTRRRRTFAASRRRRSPTRPLPTADLVVVAVPSRVFGEVVDGSARRRARPEPDQGPRPRDRASGCRRSCAAARWPCSPARTSPRRSSGGSRRQRSSRATTSRSPCAYRSRSTRRLPRLRERGRRRRRALRRSQERHRARRRRRGRPRARRQREGGARLARPGGDAAARRVGRSPPGHVRGARRNGRPHRHVLGAFRTEP